MPSLIYDNLPFPETDLSSTPNNRALGRFFTAWGQVEVVYGMIFRELCNLAHDIGAIVFEKIGVREQLDILDDMIELIDDNDLRGGLAVSLIAVRKISVSRNKIAHSRWGTIDGQSARFWVGITTAQASDIAGEQRKGPTWRNKFIFTVDQINALTNECVAERDNLTQRLHALHEKRIQQALEGGAHLAALPGHRHPALR